MIGVILLIFGAAVYILVNVILLNQVDDTLAGVAGLTFTLGDGSADLTMTFSGTIPAINAALDGLSFVGTNDLNGAASIQIVPNDMANSGAGGALSDTDSVTITVTAAKSKAAKREKALA